MDKIILIEITREMLAPKEDKTAIVKALVPVLQMTRMCRDIVDAEYDREKEIVYLHFRDATKSVNVNMDSGAAMILDIMKAILY